MAPLYDPETQSLKPLCVRALKRIFLMCDKDKDGLLNDKELNEFQVKCFNAPLQPEELAGVKDVVRSRLENGLVDDQLTFTGFVFLHALFIERGRLETTWAVRPDFTLRFLAQVPIQHWRSGKGSFRRAHERSARRSPPSGDCSVTGVG
jgi:Ras family protein T1